MTITDEILDAVDRAADYYGNISQLAKHIGIAHSTILFWKSKKTTHISGKIWATKIKPVLSPFMNNSDGVCLVARDSSVLPGYDVQRKALPVASAPPVQRECVILDLKKMPEYDPSLETVASFAHGHSQKTCVFAFKVDRGCFAVRIDRSGIYNFPRGASILLSHETPANNDVVMVRVNKTGEILFRRYFRNNTQISLEPLDEYDPAQTMKWDCQKKHGVLLWAYPVIEVSLRFPATGEEC